MRSDNNTELELRLASRALARSGLVHAYGHCSMRLDAQRFLVSPPRPLGLLGPGEAVTLATMDGPLPNGTLGEVELHRAVYRRRPDVDAVCRIQPPAVMALSVLRRTPRPVHGFSSYFAPGVPLHDSPLLARDDRSADDVVATLGSASAVVMRGNGAVVVGPDIRTAVCLAWYLEDAARVEIALLTVPDDVVVLTDAEATARAIWSGGLADRMWQHLTAGDPEIA